MKQYKWLKVVPYSGTTSGVVEAETLEEAKAKAIVESYTTHLEAEWRVKKDYGATIQHVFEGWTGFVCFIALYLYERIEK